MDYEQKYKAALEWMHGMYGGLHGKTKEEAEKYFPELAESEDEKVKRMLHSISSKMSFHLHDIFTEEEFQCFDAWSNAWLEKQGEQKSAVWSDKDENMLKSIIATCELAEQDRDSSPAKHLLEMQTNWLKSLKQRIHASSAKTCKNDTILYLLNKMPYCITVKGRNYQFVLKKTTDDYIACYECEEDSGKTIFWIAGEPVDVLTAMLDKLKEEGLLE